MRFFIPITLIVLTCGLHNVFALSVELPQITITCSPTGTSCSWCTSYKCDSGYYGTATSASAGCTACPSNATCAGGNDSTFVCNTGYYKGTTSCYRCPSETSYDGTYIYGTTSGPGAAAVTNCYMPANTPIKDWSGTYEYTSNCYYDNKVEAL